MLLLLKVCVNKTGISKVCLEVGLLSKQKTTRNDQNWIKNQSCIYLYFMLLHENLQECKINTD